MRESLARRSPEATAFVGTTFPAAVGAMRACWEKGLVAGRDISICSINIEKPARFMTPSVTGLDTPNLSKLLRRCFEWFEENQQWKGNTLMEPVRAEFFEGESTGPAQKSRETRPRAAATKL